MNEKHIFRESVYALAYYLFCANNNDNTNDLLSFQ